ncbi:MAG: Bug family tripartite tricarboxylate transporter substrate binding protein [Rhodoferax sp.]
MFHRISRRVTVRLAATLLACCTSLSSQAQGAWPTAKPITLVVPFSAGGNVDVTARLVGQKLAERLKQSVIIENVVGAGGTIGVEKAVRAAPDGYTLVLGADSPVAIAKLVNPAAVRYDGLKDLAPIGLVTTAPMVIVARPGLAASNLADVIRLAKEKPGQLSYATSGVGTVLHLTMELLKEQSKTYMVHVPYRGGAQIVTDVIGNQVDLAMVVSVTATPQIQGKKLKGIAVTEARRLPSLPDLPAVAETTGFKGFDMVSWTGLFAPAQTPPAVVERLNRELMEVLRSDEVRHKLAEGGATAGTGSALDFSRFVQQEQARYAAIVKTANIRD